MSKSRGTLKTWITGKGYGFVRPDEGGRDVFVHIRDFGLIAREPRPGDVLRYKAMADGTGRLRAGDVDVEGLPRQTRVIARRLPLARRPSQPSRPSRPSRPKVGLLVLVVISIGGLAAYFGADPIRHSTFFDLSSNSSDVPHDVPTHKCEGKRYCSEMASCEEATFYLHSCPNTEMDGDRDGIPCERQWCQ